MAVHLHNYGIQSFLLIYAAQAFLFPLSRRKLRVPGFNKKKNEIEHSKSEIQPEMTPARPTQ